MILSNFQSLPNKKPNYIKLNRKQHIPLCIMQKFPNKILLNTKTFLKNNNVILTSNIIGWYGFSVLYNFYNKEAVSLIA